MNEQIKQLWVQAAKTTQGDSWEEQTKFMERFAELIVLECVNCCDEVDRINKAFIQDYDYDPQNGPKECIQVIKEHFGVGDIPAP